MTDAALNVDPFTVDYPERIALAKSILQHTTPPDAGTRLAIERAVLALKGATIDELREVTD